MGSIKKPRKKYEPPTHPWQRARLEEESRLRKEYGTKNKREIWKIDYILKGFKKSAKKLIASTTRQSELERKQLIDRLKKYGLADDNTKMEDVLNLKIADIMNRRLQTLVNRKNLTKTIRQARQFIVHGHILVNNKKITTPNYLVLKSEEELITFDPASMLAKSDHPERIVLETKEKKEPDSEKTEKKAKKEIKNKKGKVEKKQDKKEPIKEGGKE